MYIYIFIYLDRYRFTYNAHVRIFVPINGWRHSLVAPRLMGVVSLTQEIQEEAASVEDFPQKIWRKTDENVTKM
jgi:hypothetical protein